MGTKRIGDEGDHHLTEHMPSFQDKAYLTKDQYHDTGNLNARIQLHERFSTNPYGWFRWVFDQLNFPADAHVLELGCGSGAVWVENIARIQPDWHITLSDLSPGMVTSCKDTLRSAPAQFYFGVLDAAVLPFDTSSFDAVIANHMLYHVPDRSRVFAQIARVLKPAGQLYAATNGEKHLLELDQLIEQYLRVKDKGLLSGKPSRYFTLENGAAQMAPWFGQVDLHYYPDALLITEAEPLAAYIQSMIPRDGLYTLNSHSIDIDQIIRDLIQQRGSIHIQKSSGLFIAKK